MELRRVADALVRSHTSPLATFLAPSTTLRWSTQQQIRSRVAGNVSIGRQFSASTRLNVNWTPITTSAPPSSKEEPASSATPGSQEDPSLDSLVSALGWTSKNRATSSPDTAREDREKRFNKGNTASELLNAMNLSKDMPRYPSAGRGAPFSLGRMKMPPIPGGAVDPSKDVLLITNTLEEPKRKLLKLGPSTGRSIEIGGSSVDIGRGFQLLNMSCARNKVMKDLSRQRFHERPGLKRKRLARERWRQKFAIGFNAAVKRVRTLQRQGW